MSLVYYQSQNNASMEFYAAKESSSLGVLAFDAPKSEGPTVLQLIFPMDRGSAVTATMVL